MGAVSHVYAKCSGGREVYLQTMHTGTRHSCEKYIRERVRQGLPTHFLFISKMKTEEAAKRWL